MKWDEAVQTTPKQAGGNYMRFQDGANKFRILSDPIMGWEYWTTENKPKRSKERPEGVPQDARYEDNGQFRLKYFWAFIVWNYLDGKLQILEITQATIQQQITDLVNSDDWGEPNQYDLTVTRKGKELQTEYTVQPSPHSELDTKIKEQYEKAPITLESLYSGDDPFSEVVDFTVEDNNPF